MGRIVSAAKLNGGEGRITSQKRVVRSLFRGMKETPAETDQLQSREAENMKFGTSTDRKAEQSSQEYVIERKLVEKLGFHPVI
jgi:hypothetical protein